MFWCYGHFSYNADYRTVSSPIVQEMGTSETAVMSQYMTSIKIDELKNEIFTFGNIKCVFIDGISIRGTNGSYNENVAYAGTDFIEIEGNVLKYTRQSYKLHTTMGLAFYKEQNTSTFISGEVWDVNADNNNLHESIIIVPKNAKFVRFSVLKSQKSNFYAAFNNVSKLELLENGIHSLNTKIDNNDFNTNNESSIYNNAEILYKYNIKKNGLQIYNNNGLIQECSVDIWDEIYKQYLKCTLCDLNAGDNYIICTNNECLDLADKSIVGSFALPKDYDVSGIERIVLEIIDVSGNQAKMSILSHYDNISDRVRFYRGGWYHFGSPVGSIAASYKNFDIHNVIGWRLRITSNNDISVYINSVNIIRNLKCGGVLIIVDNMNPKVPLMCDYASNKGIKMNCSIVPGYIGSTNPSISHASEEQIETCARQGHFIFNHTYNHYSGNDWTLEQECQGIVKGEKWLCEHGYKDGSRVISVPSAAFNNLKYQAYFSIDTKMIYHHWTSAVSHPLYTPQYPMSKLLNITYLDSLGSKTSMDIANFWIDSINKAIIYGGISVIGMHGTFWDNDPQYSNGEAFKYFIDSISEMENLTVYTIEDLLECRYF